MTHEIDAVADTHLEIWNTDDDAERRRRYPEAYAPDVRVDEPTAGYDGFDGMTAAISGLHGMAPDASLSRTSAIQTAGDLATYSWSLAPAGQPPIATGRDVLIVEDGRIRRLYVVIDAPTG